MCGMLGWLRYVVRNSREELAGWWMLEMGLRRLVGFLKACCKSNYGCCSIFVGVLRSVRADHRVYMTLHQDISLAYQLQR